MSSMSIREQILLSSRNSTGLTVSAYKRSRFSSDPVAGSPPPDLNPADYTSVIGKDQTVEFARVSLEAFWLTWLDGVVDQWLLIESPAAAVIPSGGTAGQVVTKRSALDYDIDWGTPSGVGGSESVLAFAQAVPAAVWNINHNLGSYPVVTVIDSAGSLVEGDVDYIDANHIILGFGAAFAGVAYLD